MCVQPVGAQSRLGAPAGLPLNISYGKTKLRLGASAVHPPVAPLSPPNGPLVLTTMLPFWLSWYHRCPSTGSMRAYIPSPPLRCDHRAGPTLLSGHTNTLDPLSCAPALIPGELEVAKLAVISPE